MPGGRAGATLKVVSVRPDPDTLLARVKDEEARQRRGKLKVFFGAAAGVGKTYAMLKVAHERRASGIDVVAGYVETHGRAETDALLENLEILPPRQVEYHGATLVKYAGRVVTQRQLLRDVWGPNAEEQSHYLRVYMTHLRRKLELDPARPRYLVTEPGVGYRLLAE